MKIPGLTFMLFSALLLGLVLQAPAENIDVTSKQGKTILRRC